MLTHLPTTHSNVSLVHSLTPLIVQNALLLIIQIRIPLVAPHQHRRHCSIEYATSIEGATGRRIWELPFVRACKTKLSRHVVSQFHETSLILLSLPYLSGGESSHIPSPPPCALIFHIAQNTHIMGTKVGETHPSRFSSLFSFSASH